LNQLRATARDAFKYYDIPANQSLEECAKLQAKVRRQQEEGVITMEAYIDDMNALLALEAKIKKVLKATGRGCYLCGGKDHFAVACPKGASVDVDGYESTEDDSVSTADSQALAYARQMAEEDDDEPDVEEHLRRAGFEVEAKPLPPLPVNMYGDKGRPGVVLSVYSPNKRSKAEKARAKRKTAHAKRWAAGLPTGGVGKPKAVSSGTDSSSEDSSESNEWQWNSETEYLDCLRHPDDDGVKSFASFGSSDSTLTYSSSSESSLSDGSDFSDDSEFDSCQSFPKPPPMRKLKTYSPLAQEIAAIAQPFKAKQVTCSNLPEGMDLSAQATVQNTPAFTDVEPLSLSAKSAIVTWGIMIVVIVFFGHWVDYDCEYLRPSPCPAFSLTNIVLGQTSNYLCDALSFAPLNFGLLNERLSNVRPLAWATGSHYNQWQECQREHVLPLEVRWAVRNFGAREVVICMLCIAVMFLKRRRISYTPMENLDCPQGFDVRLVSSQARGVKLAQPGLRRYCVVEFSGVLLNDIWSYLAGTHTRYVVVSMELAVQLTGSRAQTLAMMGNSLKDLKTVIVNNANAMDQLNINRYEDFLHHVHEHTVDLVYYSLMSEQRHRMGTF
jgi:hypothetical protein